MADIKQYSMEMYELMDFFERTIKKAVYVGGDFKREDKSMWQKCQYYCNGSVNDMFKVFLCGYTYRKSIEGTCFDKSEQKQENTLTYYLDKVDGCVGLCKHDRTVANTLADNKGEAVGKLMAMIINELDNLPNNGTISVTFNRDV